MEFTRTTAAITAVVVSTAVVVGLVVANTGDDEAPVATANASDVLVGDGPDLSAGDDVLLGGDPVDDVLLGDLPDDDVLLSGDASDDVLLGGDPVDDDVLLSGDPADDVLLGEESFGDFIVLDAPEPSGLRRLCLDVRHQAVPDQNAASGIWVNGEVYGLGSDVWIYVEAPTINNGEGLDIVVDNGFFEAPLGINRFGDHPLEQFELRSHDPAVAPIDLLPTLAAGPGTTFPVGPGEGPVFDQECFEFDPLPGPDRLAPSDPEEQAAQQAADLLHAEAITEEFFVGFVDDHRNGRTDRLLETLHPAVPLAFGDEECTGYVERTTGSIVGAEVLSVSTVVEFELDSPNGPIAFPEAIPFSVEFRLADDSTVTNDGNLALHDGTAHWLTTCGN